MSPKYVAAFGKSSGHPKSLSTESRPASWSSAGAYGRTRVQPACSMTWLASARSCWLTGMAIAVVMAFTAAALVLDILEINHQFGAGDIELGALAGLIAALRVATLVGSAYLYRYHPVAR